MIIKATLQDAAILTKLGVETFYNSHKDSAPPHEIDTYIRKTYSLDVIKKELAKLENVYHLLKHGNEAAGFSKLELNMKHSTVEMEKVSKMDQIYLLESFQGLKLGAKLLHYNIEYSKSRGQNGMWLIVWAGNTTAITFYEKFGFYIISSDKFLLTDTHLSPCYIMLLKYNKS